MNKAMIFCALACRLLAVLTCWTFSPHRTNTDFHRQAHADQFCSGWHSPKELGHNHQETDDCRRCHSIVQGD